MSNIAYTNFDHSSWLVLIIILLIVGVSLYMVIVDYLTDRKASIIDYEPDHTVMPFQCANMYQGSKDGTKWDYSLYLYKNGKGNLTWWNANYTRSSVDFTFKSDWLELTEALKKHQRCSNQREYSDIMYVIKKEDKILSSKECK